MYPVSKAFFHILITTSVVISHTTATIDANRGIQTSLIPTGIPRNSNPVSSALRG